MSPAPLLQTVEAQSSPKPPATAGGVTESPAFFYICLAAAFLFSTARIKSSLWLDETATYWVVKDGLREVVARSWEWSGQSALYYLTAWMGRHVAPYTGLEIALRLPSVFAMAAAASLIYRLGRYLMDAKAGAAAALAFLCVPEISFATIDARPYALALAILVASTLCFFKWLDTGRLLYAVLYVITTALVVYAHYLFALGLAAQLVYGFRREPRVAWLWAMSAVLCLPLTGQFLHFFNTRHTHSYAPTPDADAFFSAIVPPVLAGAALFAVIGRRRTAAPAHFAPWDFLFAWLVLPPAILFLISVFTETKLFVPRYYLGCMPAAALLAGYVIVRCSAVRLASGVLLASMAFSIWRAGPRHDTDDWRGAMQAVSKQAAADDAVLVGTGFIEGAANPDAKPIFREVLYAPQIAYPVKSFVRLPFSFDAAAVPDDVVGRRRIFLVTWHGSLASISAGGAYESVLKRKLDGYAARGIGNFGTVSVVRFDR